MQENTPLLEDQINKDKLVKVTRLITVEPLTFFYFLASASTRIIVEQLVFGEIAKSYNYTPNGNGTGDSTCGSSSNVSSGLEQTQQRSALVMEFLEVATIFPSLFTSIIIGFFSHQVGRKLAMLLPLFGGLLRNMMMIIIISCKLDPLTIFIPFLLDGLLGTTPAFMAATFSYISDITTYTSRTFRVGLVHIAFKLGSVMSIFFSGYLISGVGYIFTFVILLSIQALGILYCIFLVPETVIREEKIHLITLKPFKQMWELFSKNDKTNRRWKLHVSLVILLVAVQLEAARVDIQTYFLLGEPLCWSSQLVGIYNAEYMLVGIVGVFVAVKLLGRCMGEAELVMLGSLSGVAAYTYLVFVNTSAMMFTLPILAVFESVCQALPFAIASKQVDPRELGSLFGVFSSVGSLMAVIGIIIYNSIYAATLSTFVGITFIIMASEYMVNFFLGLFFAIRSKYEAKEKQKLWEASQS